MEDSADDAAVASAALAFCKNIIDATSPYAVAYKPNAAFFECLGSNGHDTLLEVIRHIPEVRKIRGKRDWGVVVKRAPLTRLAVCVRVEGIATLDVG